jgi:hypothetical protein
MSATSKLRATNRSGIARTEGARLRRARRARVEALEDRTLLSTYTVTDTNDSGPGSLRQGILNANSVMGPSDIIFSIGSGPQTITPLSPLPAITRLNVTIDATSQPGYAGVPLIEIDGASAGAGANGLTVSAPNVTIQGFVINRFSANGIVLSGSAGNSDVIASNYIGTNAAGTAALGNGQDGIAVTNGVTGVAIIGGTVAAARNVISGNGLSGIAIVAASGMFILMNYIGTNAAGSAAIPNAERGVDIFGGSTGNEVGQVGTGNVISGNGWEGVGISGVGTSNNAVFGNYIGTNATGLAAIPNSLAGVNIFGGATFNNIGQTTYQSGNVISGNGTDGIQISGAGTSGNGVQNDFVGTNASGTVALPNGNDGVQIFGGATNNTIGNVPGNVLSGNQNYGLVISGSGTSGNLAWDNLIGPAADGRSLLTGRSPTGSGVGLFAGASNNTIGATAPNLTIGNVISGNSMLGILISGAGTSNNFLSANGIGTAMDHQTAIGNGGPGVEIANGATGNILEHSFDGVSNAIANNGGPGVAIINQGTVNNTIRQNAIYNNNGLGIDLGYDSVTPDHGNTVGVGPNNLQNYPMITSVTPGTTTTLTLAFESLPNSTYTLDFYSSTAPNSSGYGDAKSYLGAILVTTDANGYLNPATTYTLPVATTSGQWITATATDQSGNTSEFSFAQQILSQPHGTWTPILSPASAGTGTMILLSDGSVMVQAGGIPNAWYRYAPDSYGDYATGTWSQLASMSTPRLYFASNVLKDGRVFVEGGEYSDPSHPNTQTEVNTGEIYDPVANTWTSIATFPQSTFGDDPSQLLPDGRVLTGYNEGPQTYIYDPTANTWSLAATKFRPEASAEESWLKLPDDSILTYEVNTPGTTGHAERYIPSTNSWVDAGTVPVLLSNSTVDFEIGPGFLLPDGRAFYLGATGHTAFYSPSTNSWTAGPDIPNGLGADDVPGAMMPNGKILFAADTPLFHGPVSIFEFDPVAGTFTNVTPLGFNLGSTGSAGYTDRFLILPTGQVLFSNDSNVLALYTPAGSPSPSALPTITNITNNGNGTYTLTGTQLNGISQGAAYGDDAEMDTNYPIVRLADTTGDVWYARTSNWTSTGVATGSAVVGTRFTLSSGIPAGNCSLTVIASGIASNPYSFTYGVVTTSTVSAAPSSPTYGQQVTFTATVSATPSTPTGTVQVVIDGSNYGAPLALSGGTATTTDSALSAGSHSISVIYVPSSGTGFLPSNGSLSGGLTVAKAHLTVNADPKSKPYGAAVPTLTDTITGFVNGDTISVVSGAASLNTTATVSSGVGPYSITVGAGTLSAANYDFPNLVNGTLTVNPAHLTVTADPQSMIYGGAVPTLTATLSGFVLGENAATASVTGAASLTTTATSASPVGNYVITTAVGTLAAPNYDFPNLINGSLAITKAHLTVTADPQAKLYGDAVPVLTATISGFVNGDNLAVVSGSPALSTTATVSGVVGTYPISVAIGTLVAANYDFPTLVNGVLTVNKAHLTVTADPKSMVYGTAVPNLTTTLSGFVLGQTATTAGITGAAAPATSATSASSAGTYAIVSSAGTLAAPNYDFSNLVNGTLTINKAHLTVTADNKVKLYGDSVPALTATISGFVNGDTVAAVSGAPSLSTSASSASPIGNYTITIALGTLSATNYDFPNLVNGTLTIGKAHLTVTADPQGKLYGAAVPSLTATISGFVNSDPSTVVSGTPTLSTSVTVSSGVGSYPITVGLGSLSAANYDFPNFVNGTLTVNPAHLTVTADPKSMIYGAAVPPLTATLSGFVLGQSATTAGVTGSAAPSTNATSASHVGTYTITSSAGTLAAPNYDFPNLVNGLLTINQAHLTVSVDPKAKLYGDPVPTLSATISGFVNGDTAAVVSGAPFLNTIATAASPIGTYPITIALGNLAATNYDFPNLIGSTLTVGRAHLTVTADAQAKFYGATVPTLTATISGFVNGDSSTVVSGSPSLSTPATQISVVGTYPITVAVGTLAAANYDFPTLVNGVLTINKAHLTVTADPKARLYGGATSLSATLSGFVLGETAVSANVTGTAALSTAATPASPVGTYPITVTAGSLAAPNYDFLLFVNSTLTINKAHLSVTADPIAKLYGDAVPPLTATLSGFVNGDTRAVVSGAPTLTTAATTASLVGSYPIATGLGSLSATNYDFLTLVNGALTVGKAHLTVTADPKAKLYGASLPALTATLSGFVLGETSSVVAGAPALATSATVASAVGNYPITVGLGTLSATNYDFPNLVSGALSVNKAHLTVTADPKAKLYGDPLPTFTATLSGFVLGDTAATAGITGAAAPTTAATSASPVGNYTISAAAGTLTAPNYDFPNLVGSTLTVNRAHLTVTADAKAKLFGDAVPVLTFTVSGFVNGDTTAVVSGSPLLSTSATSASQVGTYPIAISIGSLIASNYDYPTLDSGTLTVNRAHLTVSADPKAKLYGDAVPVLTYNIAGFVNGDSATVVSGAPTLSTTATATGAVGSYPITVGLGTLAATNYDFSNLVNGSLAIGKAHLTVTADPKTMLYGASLPVLTASLSGFVLGETPATAGLSGAPTLITLATSGSPVGSYTIRAGAGTLTAANYDFPNLVNGLLTVSSAHLTITADAKTKIYGAAIPALTATMSGFVNGDTAVVVSGAPSLNTSATASSPVGIYLITIGVGNLAASNYDFPTLVGASLTVTKAHLTVSADAQAKLFGASVPSLTATLSGFALGQTATTAGITGAPVLSTSATPASAVGSYPINVAVGTLAAPNYDITNLINGTLSVGKAHLTVAADAKTKLYGDAVPPLSASLSGFVNGDTSAVVSGSAALSTPATSSSGAGTYPISAGAGTLSATNYDFSNLVNGTLTINKAHLTVTADPKTKLYGAAVPALSATYTGLVNNDTAAVVAGAPALTTTATASSGAGSYPITAGLGTLSATNYDFPTLVNATLTVNKAHLTVTADTKVRAHGIANPPLTFTITGFFNGDTRSVVAGAPGLNTSAITASLPGSYPIAINLGGLSAANYDFPSLLAGTLIVRSAGDFNGDGKTDTAIYDQTISQFFILLSGGGALTPSFGNPAHVNIPIAGDFDGDGKSDVAIYDQTTSTFYVLLSSGGAIVQAFGNPSHVNIPIAGDFDGDGKTDLAIYDQTSSQFFILFSGGGAETPAFGDPTHVNVPVAGDFNGDGKSDIAIYDQTASRFYVLLSGGGAMTPFFGNPSHTNVPLAGDFDGDGKSDLAVYDQTTSQFFVLYSGGGAETPLFGNPAHVNVPVAGDYDGDGKTDIGIYDQTSSQFFILFSGGGAETPLFGNPAHHNVPIPSVYLRGLGSRSVTRSISVGGSSSFDLGASAAALSRPSVTLPLSPTTCGSTRQKSANDLALGAERSHQIAQEVAPAPIGDLVRVHLPRRNINAHQRRPRQ